MKKLLLPLLLTGLLLCACGAPETEESVRSDLPPAAESGETADVTAPETPPEEEIQEPEAPAPEERIITPEEAYDGYGYVHFLAEETGTYHFEPIHSEGIEWRVYLLDEEFTDAERYIPHAYEEALIGAGDLSVSAGTYIYVYSTANSWTQTEIPAGAACHVTFTK